MYPKDFLKDLRDEFPDRDDMLAVAEEGRYVLGRLLAKEAQACLDPDEVVRLFEAGRSEEVLASARRAVRRRDLHRRWIQFMLRATDSADSENAAERSSAHEPGV